MIYKTVGNILFLCLILYGNAQDDNPVAAKGPVADDIDATVTEDVCRNFSTDCSSCIGTTNCTFFNCSSEADSFMCVSSAEKFDNCTAVLNKTECDAFLPTKPTAAPTPTKSTAAPIPPTKSTAAPTPPTKSTAAPTPPTKSTDKPPANMTSTEATKTTKAGHTVPTKKPATTGRRFDAPSFIGGIVLSLGIMAICYVAFKFYKARTERNYHTLHETVHM
ncbi:CD164 (predicted) [Pycnogonum litorale]